jgi:hypothetical protein
MSDSTEGRIAVNAHSTPSLPYDLEGPVQPELSWLPISFDHRIKVRLSGSNDSASEAAALRSRFTLSSRAGRSR